MSVFAGQNGLDVGKADSINNSGGSLGEHPEMEDERTAIPPYLLKMPTPQVSCRPLYRLLNLLICMSAEGGQCIAQLQEHVTVVSNCLLYYTQSKLTCPVL